MEYIPHNSKRFEHSLKLLIRGYHCNLYISVILFAFFSKRNFLVLKQNETFWEQDVDEDDDDEDEDDDDEGEDDDEDIGDDYYDYEVADDDDDDDDDDEDDDWCWL